jgi:hypothetical protein
MSAFVSALDAELLQEFQKECRELLKELGTLVESLEEVQPAEAFPAQLLADFAQRIDRIMGAAETFEAMDPGNPGLRQIGKLARLCKILGNQAVQKKQTKLTPLFAAFWGETLDILEELVESLTAPDKAGVWAKAAPVIQKRLEWLAGHVGIDPATLGAQF